MVARAYIFFRNGSDIPTVCVKQLQQDMPAARTEGNGSGMYDRIGEDIPQFIDALIGVYMFCRCYGFWSE